VSGSSPVAAPSFRACRQAARAVRAAQESRQAIATVRPRGVAFVRSRAPLALLIRLAALEGRLVWQSADAFAVLEPPAGGAPPTPAGAGTLRFLDRHWDLLIFAVPALLALVSVAGLALLPATRVAALLMALFATLWATAAMTAVAIKGSAWMYRVLIAGRAQELGEAAVGQLRGLHWSIPLLHTTRPSDVATILPAISQHIIGLVHQVGRQAAATRPVEDDWSDIALCLEHGVTTRQARHAVRAADGVTPLPGHPVLVVSLGRDRLLREPPGSSTYPASAVPLLVLGMATVVGVGAQQVAEAEGCDGRPASYGDAVYWLLNRLLGGDPGGLAAGSLPARAFGLLVSLMGLVVIGWVITSILQRSITRVLATGPDLARAYNQAAADGVSPQHTAHRVTVSPPSAVTPTIVAGGVVVVAFLGYVLGRIRLRRPRRGRS
jgi:hypothetical protein